MGQYIQEGERTLFETIVSVAESKHTVRVEADEDNLDGLNFLAGKRISEINRMAELGVRIAHVDGGVPNMRIEIARIDERTIGQLLYFFEKACGISGYLLGVNPFNQPGVEAYKKNMFALLDKPGYEEESKKIKRACKRSADPICETGAFHTESPCLVDVSPPILPPALSALHAPGLGSRPALT